MKKKLLAMVFIFGLLLPLSAQMHLFMQEQSVQVEDATLSAWVMPIPSSFEFAQKQFQDFAKDRVDIRLRKKDDMLYIAEKVSVPRVATPRGDMIAYTFASSGHSDIAIAFRLGYDISLNSILWPSEMGNLRSLSKEFMSHLYSEFYTDSIAVLEKDLKSLEKEKKSFEKDLDGNSNKISRNNKSLEKEDDEVKIADIKAEIGGLESENERILQLLPDLENNIGKLRMKMGALRNEMLEVINAIGAL